jgi:hypothetical protein
MSCNTQEPPPDNLNLPPILKIKWFSDCHKFVTTENQTIVTNGGL